MLYLLTVKADIQIDIGISETERRKAEGFFHQAEATLAAMDRSWSDGTVKAPLEEIESFRTVYRGSIASGQAVLAGDKGDVKAANLGFDEAKRQFQSALQLTDQYPRLDLRDAVESRLKAIEERSRRFLRPR